MGKEKITYWNINTNQEQNKFIMFKFLKWYIEYTYHFKIRVFKKSSKYKLEVSDDFSAFYPTEFKSGIDPYFKDKP